MWEAGEEMPPPGGKSCSEYVGSSSKVIDHSPVSYYATSQDLSRSVRTCIHRVRSRNRRISSPTPLTPTT